MGCVSQKDADNPKALSVLTPFVIQLETLRAHLEPTFFILPTQYETFRNNYSQLINDINLTVFRDWQELEKYKDDDKNNVLIICCENINEVNKARSFSNFHAFSRIGLAYNFHIDNLSKETETKEREMGFRFNGFLPQTPSDIGNFFNNALTRQSMYFCDKHTGLINRAYLLFDYYYRRKENNNMQLFLNWLNLRGEAGYKLKQLIESHTRKEQLGKNLVNNIFAENQILLEAIELLGSTQNPGIIEHVSWFGSIIFDFIKNSYKKSLRKLQQLRTSELVIWIKLSEQEAKTMMKGKDENFTFSTFMMGYTNKNHIIPQESNDYHRIYVNLPKDINDFKKFVDQGFYIDQDRIIFNMMNMYRVDDVSVVDKSITVTYCSIGSQYNLRSSADFRYSRDAKKSNVKMMRLFDYYLYSRKFIKNQYDLIFFLQMYETYKEIIRNSLNRTITNSQCGANTGCTLASTISTMNESALHSTMLNQKLGDAQFSTKNYQSALQCYGYLKPTVKGYIKKLYLYQMTKNGKEFKNTIEQYNNFPIDQNKPRENVSKFTDIALNCFLVNMLNKGGEFRQAGTKIQNLITSLSQAFEELASKNTQELTQFHPDTFISYPLYYMLINVKASINRNKGEDVTAKIDEEIYQDSEQYFDGVHRFWLE